MHTEMTLPFIQGDLGAPVIKRSRYVDLLPRSSPTNDRGSSLGTSLDQVVQVRGELLLSGSLRTTHQAALWKWLPKGKDAVFVCRQHLGFWPVGVEDVGVIGAVHHLAAGFVVLVAAAVGAVGLGSVAVCRHPVACISHDASPLGSPEDDDSLW